MDFRAYIISWAGQHENAARIAAALDAWRDRIAIVYSDPDPEVEPQAKCSKIRRPNELFWADKFQACLESCDAEVLMVLHADCSCDNWPDVIERSAVAFNAAPSLGVWAPSMRGCHFEIESTRIARSSVPSLSLVAQTDAICFAISRRVAERMKRADYADNMYGWGIGWLFAAYAHCNNLLVIADEGLEVHHAIGRGYPAKEAWSQMNRFLRQFTPQEFVQYRVLSSYVDARQRQHLAATAGTLPNE